MFIYKVLRTLEPYILKQKWQLIMTVQYETFYLLILQILA